MTAARKGYRPCKTCGQNRAERFYVSPRGRICLPCQSGARKKASHEKRVKATYGLGPGEYAALFEAQGGRCAICGGTRRDRLDVDHDHASGLIRGLLCRNDNRRLLTAARDQPDVLRAAADYLESPPAVGHIGERFYSGDPPPARRRGRR